MKKITFLAASMLMACGSVFAQDPVHGVGGYYNYTAAQLESENCLNVGGNGKKFAAKWHPEYRFEDGYLRFTLGANDAAFKEDRGGYHHRSSVGLKEKVAGQGVMTITKDYPVLVFKMSAVYNNEDLKEGFDAYWEPELRMYDATGAKVKIPMSGLDDNSRYRFFASNPNLKDQFGRDSVQLNKGNNGYDARRGANTVHSTPTNVDTIWRIVRIPAEVQEKADILIALDFSTICDQGTEDGSGVRMLDTTDITMVPFDVLSGINVYADTIYYAPDDAEHANPLVKTKDMMPYCLLKWVKTFRSMGEFSSMLNDENNWGDGAPVDPQKPILNAKLYECNEFIAAYKFSDKLEPLQAAYDAALAVYNNPESTGDDYKAQVDALSKAEEDFLASISYTVTEKMNRIFNLGGMALGLESEPTTAGGFTGCRIVGVEETNAVDFYFSEAGTANGQTNYNLKLASSTLVQAGDGTLLMVDVSQVKTAAALTFCNRGQEDNPGFDIKCGKYYYQLNEEGVLTAIETIPTVEEYNALNDYLFFLTEAEPYNPEDHNAETHPMTSGEGSGWEFNGKVSMEVDPAFQASFDMFDWDAEAKAAATQRTTIPFVEGWRSNGFRLGSVLEIDNTTAYTGSNALSCLRTYYKAEVDNFHADTINTSMETTDYASALITLMREHGKYTSASNRVPQPNQLCDSTCAINLNSGINRYFAMKWKSNSEDVKLNGFVFFVLKGIEEPTCNMDNLLEQRGDVYIWDLLECGIPYGDRKACAQYLNWKGIKSEEDVVYVDWIRFYDSLEAIPEETMTFGKEDSGEGGGEEDAITAPTVEKEIESTVIYSISGAVEPALVPGVNFVKTIYKDGTSKVEKVIE